MIHPIPSRLEALRQAVESRNWVLVEIAVDALEKSLRDAQDTILGTPTLKPQFAKGDRVMHTLFQWRGTVRGHITSPGLQYEVDWDHEGRKLHQGSWLTKLRPGEDPKGSWLTKPKTVPEKTTDWDSYSMCVYCDAETGKPCVLPFNVARSELGKEVRKEPHLGRRKLSDKVGGEEGSGQSLDGTDVHMGGCKVGVPQECTCKLILHAETRNDQEKGEVVQSTPPVPTPPHSHPMTEAYRPYCAEHCPKINESTAHKSEWCPTCHGAGGGLLGVCSTCQGSGKAKDTLAPFVGTDGSICRSESTARTPLMRGATYSCCQHCIPYGHLDGHPTPCPKCAQVIGRGNSECRSESGE